MLWICFRGTEIHMKATITEESKVVIGVKCSMKHIDQKHLNNQQNHYKSKFKKINRIRGKTYTCHWLLCHVGAVEVFLVWGDFPAQRGLDHDGMCIKQCPEVSDKLSVFMNSCRLWILYTASRRHQISSQRSRRSSLSVQWSSKPSLKVSFSIHTGLSF